MEKELWEIVGRLKLLRNALGLSQAKLCQQTGLLASSWSMYESGERPFTLESAMALRKKYGVSTDWIFFGDTVGLPKGLFDLIETERLKSQQKAAE